MAIRHTTRCEACGKSSEIRFTLKDDVSQLLAQNPCECGGSRYIDYSAARTWFRRENYQYKKGVEFKPGFYYCGDVGTGDEYCKNFKEYQAKNRDNGVEVYQ